MSFLEKLRNESEAKRKRFAILWASILTLIIFLVWFSIFQLDFGVKKTKKSVGSPFESLNSVVGSFGEDIYTAVTEIKDKVGGVSDGTLQTDNSDGEEDNLDTTSQDLPFR